MAITWTAARGHTFLPVEATMGLITTYGRKRISGCSVTEATPNTMHILVSSGVCCQIATTTQFVPAADLLLTSDPTYPKMYLIYLDGAGTAQAFAGTPNPISPSGETDFKKMESPYPPDWVSGSIPLAIVYVAANATQLSNATILDIGITGYTDIPQWFTKDIQTVPGILVINNNETIISNVSMEMATAGYVINGTLVIMEV
jgi:hypothetical protein